MAVLSGVTVRSMCSPPFGCGASGVGAGVTRGRRSSRGSRCGPCAHLRSGAVPAGWVRGLLGGDGPLGGHGAVHVLTSVRVRCQRGGCGGYSGATVLSGVTVRSMCSPPFGCGAGGWVRGLLGGDGPLGGHGAVHVLTSKLGISGAINHASELTDKGYFWLPK